MKKFFIILAILFFIPLLVLGLVSVFDTDETKSMNENRNLASMPELSLKSWFDGEFASGFEEYYTDTFPFRERLLDFNQSLSLFYHFTFEDEDSVTLITFDESVLVEGSENIETLDMAENTAVVEPTSTPAKDDDTTDAAATIAPTPESTSTPELEFPELGDEFKIGTGLLIIGDRAMSVVNGGETKMARYAELMTEIATRMEDTNFYSVIVPTSCEFYSPEFYHSEQRSQKYMLDYCYGLMENVNVANPYQYLYDNANDYIYFRTDHHWTALGAYYGYVAFCDAADIEPVDINDFEEKSYENFIGSFYGYTKEYKQSKNLYNNPDTIYYYMPIVETDTNRYNNTSMQYGVNYKLVNDELYDKYGSKFMCFIGGDFPVIKVDTSVDNGKACLVIKDSYGNVFAPFLVSHYETVYIIDPRKFNCEEFPAVFRVDDFVEENEVDDVILVNNTYNINSNMYNWLLYKAFLE